MKPIIEIISCFSILLLVVLSLNSCNSQQRSQTHDTENIIDSLIQVNRINEKTLLVTFGAEAITAINTQQGIAVIDAGISTGLTTKLREKIENVFRSNHFTCVVNTHAHPDHNGGNSVFSESRIVGHKNGLEEIDDQWADPEKVILALEKIVGQYDSELKDSEPNTDKWIGVFIQKTRYLNALNDAKDLIPIKKPNMTFSDSMSIDMGDVNFEMIYFGKCHSNSDILIYVPELKILFTGDLMFKYGRPSINNNLVLEKERWNEAVQWIEQRMQHIETIIGGHGQILSIDDLNTFKEKILEEIR